MARTVLVVDDDTELRMATREVLMDEGFVVLCAPDAQGALALLRNGATPDLILVDQMMPGMTGRELCRRLAGEPAYADIPTILMTASYDRSGRDADGTPVLAKPMSIELLLDSVEASCRPRRTPARRSG
jgi:CheY-like chemotaxis protein